MLARDIDVFEVKARELILEAIRISGKKDLSLRLPPRESSGHYLLQEALVSFIGATKILIFFFRQTER